MAAAPVRQPQISRRIGPAAMTSGLLRIDGNTPNRRREVRESGDIYESSRRRGSATTSVADDAADEECESDEQPRQRIEMLVAAACRRGPPAGRVRPGALHP